MLLGISANLICSHVDTVAVLVTDVAYKAKRLAEHDRHRLPTCVQFGGLCVGPGL